MSIINDVLTAARGGIKERDEKIAAQDTVIDGLKTRLESMTNSRNYFKGERDACLELVKQAGEKEKEYNAAVERCAELEAQVAAAEQSAREFAAEFGIDVPTVDDGSKTYEPDEPAEGEVEVSAEPEPDPEPAADGGEEA